MTATPQRITYRVALDALDERSASFAAPNGGHATTLDIARADWEKLGRPSAIEITPEASDA